MMTREALWWVLLWAIPFFSLPFLLSTGGGIAGHLIGHLHQARGTSRPTPWTTGDWVRKQLTQRGLADRIDLNLSPIGTQQIDAYWPEGNTITLASNTFYSTAPADLAIGAHELGHAVHIHKHLVWRVLFTSARFLTSTLERLVLAAFLTALFWTSTELVALGSYLLYMLALFHAVVLADEAWASAEGLQTLRRERDLAKGQLREIRSALLRAWSAYGLSGVGRLTQLLLLPYLIARMPSASMTPLPDMEASTLLFLGALSLPLGKRAYRITRDVIRPPQIHTLSELHREITRENAGDLFGGLGIGLWIYLFNTPSSHLVYVLLLPLALLPALVPIVALAQTLVLAPVGILLAFLNKKSPADGNSDALDDHQPSVPPPTFGPPTLTIRLYNQPPWSRRATQILRIAYVPAVCVGWVVWVAQLGASG